MKTLLATVFALCLLAATPSFAASPAFRALNTVNDATAANITGTEPTGTAQNDILVATLYIESDTAVTAPSGWSDTFDGTVAMQEANTAGKAFRHYSWWIRRGVSAPSYAWTHASAYRGITIIAYSGAVTSEHPWSFLAQALRDNSSAQTYPNVSGTTDTNDELLVWTGRFFTGSSTNTEPTGFTERQDGVGTAALIADLAQVTAGSTGTVTGASFTGNAAPATTFMAGLKSVAAGGAAPTPKLTLMGIGP